MSHEICLSPWWLSPVTTVTMAAVIIVLHDLHIWGGRANSSETGSRESEPHRETQKWLLPDSYDLERKPQDPRINPVWPKLPVMWPNNRSRYPWDSSGNHSWEFPAVPCLWCNHVTHNSRVWISWARWPSIGSLVRICICCVYMIEYMNIEVHNPVYRWRELL